MSNKNLKRCVYIVLVLLILLFYTKDIDLNKGDSYENTKIITEPDIMQVLVNKKYYLPKNYIPNDLELVSVKYANENKYLRKEAKSAFEALSETAKKQGYTIIAVSTYRPYEYQKKSKENVSN